jgi:squalene-hopene/tetraprenyl-beta-curcumene cyclase
MNVRAAVCFVLAALPCASADWNPKLAAKYLDARQEEWFAWPTANSGAKPCISCHTGLTYLLARPVLRRALGENTPTSYETGLRNSLRSRVTKLEPPAAPSLGVESVMAALLLEQDGSPAASQALDRLWVLQSREGKAKGAWNWFSLDLDPWEMPESNFYGAALAALALGGAPAEYRSRPEVKERIADLTAFLTAGQESQTLHNRVMLMWAATKMPDLLPAAARRSIVDELWKQQQSDGGWTLASLGPFKVHEKAVRQEGTNAYATALVAFVLQRSDIANPKLGKALTWLKAHQDPEDGSWAAQSMNKQYPAGSMESKFMRDAATAYASMALLEASAK